MRWPSSMPAGTSTDDSCASHLVAAAAAQLARRRGIRPRPPQRSQVGVRTTCPKTVRDTACSWPVPPQRGQVSISVPGSAPLPPQREQVVEHLDLDRAVDAGQHLLEREGHLDADVVAAAGPPRAAEDRSERVSAAEEAPEDVGEAPEVAEVRLVAARAQARRARSGRRRRAAPGRVSTS